MKKKFDCVAMKNVIQQGLQKRWTGMAGEQRREAIHRDLDASVSAIGKVWRQLASPPAHSSTRQVAQRVAESKTRYGKN